jgi:hypothetical membrane protein
MNIGRNRGFWIEIFKICSICSHYSFISTATEVLQPLQIAPIRAYKAAFAPGPCLSNKRPAIYAEEKVTSLRIYINQVSSTVDLVTIGRQSLSAALVAVAAAMVLLDTLYFASLRPGYSHLSNTISELGETGAPRARLVGFGFFLPVGLLVWLALWLTLRHAPDQDASWVLFALSGLGAGYALSAFFPCDPGGPILGSWRTLVHNTAGVIDYGGTALGFLLFSRYSAGHKARLQSFLFGIAAVLGFLALVLLAFPPAFPVRGAVQRVTELIQFTGVFWICNFLSTRPVPHTSAGLSFGHQPLAAGERERSKL